MKRVNLILVTVVTCFANSESIDGHSCNVMSVEMLYFTMFYY